MNAMIEQLKGGLIVSCQTDNDEPFNDLVSTAKFCRAAELGGASAVRLEGIETIRSIRPQIELPMIGMVDGQFSSGWICVTPDFADIDALQDAGADCIALDVTPRKRPNGMDGIEFFEEVRNRYDIPLIADVSTFEEGIRAAEMGADAVATTLSGYTEYTQKTVTEEPDFPLIEELARALKIPVVAQGRIWNPAQASEAMKRGAWCVVAGSAITKPKMITKKFVESLRRTPSQSTH